MWDALENLWKILFVSLTHTHTNTHTLFKKHVFIWRNDREKERERGRKRDLLSVDSFLKWLQQSEMVQAEAWTLNSVRASHLGCGNPIVWDIITVPKDLHYWEVDSGVKVCHWAQIFQYGMWISQLVSLLLGLKPSFIIFIFPWNVL